MPRKSRKDLSKPKRRTHMPNPSRRETAYLDKSSSPPRRPRPSVAPRPREHRRDIDLHGLQPSDAINKLDTELRKAYSDGCRSVKVIHGKGGRDDSPAYLLRNRVRKHLRGHKLVQSINVERTSTGTNQGATIVRLRQGK